MWTLTTLRSQSLFSLSSWMVYHSVFFATDFADLGVVFLADLVQPRLGALRCLRGLALGMLRMLVGFGVAEAGTGCACCCVEAGSPVGCSFGCSPPSGLRPRAWLLRRS